MSIVLFLIHHRSFYLFSVFAVCAKMLQNSVGKNEVVKAWNKISCSDLRNQITAMK